ncbi:MAG: 3-hydroxyacyl-CoA dehydrogenase NAD-binding domain-containing protein [Solirubrobacterales bacterium]
MSGAATPIRWEKDANGVVVLTMDHPDQPVNTFNAEFREALTAAVDRLEQERDELTGVVITSAKPTFLAGADLNELRELTEVDVHAFAELARKAKLQLRRLELLELPVVAAINGAALGGGLELALACNYRIIVDDPQAVVGLPEVTLGLLPGAGGVVRSVRLLGVVEALTNLLLRGQRHRPQAALELGIVDELVDSPADALAAAKEWIARRPAGEPTVQPWDVKGYSMPGGTPSSKQLATVLPALPANLRRQLKGADYPAPKAILEAAVEGAQVDVDGAHEIELRHFIHLADGQVSKNMTQAFFFDLQAVNGPRGRDDVGKWRAQKVAVLGAGMMGAAIAYVCAKAGIAVVLKDMSLEAATRGKGYAENLVAKGKGDQALLDRITPTDSVDAVSGADLVIEAVFEDPAIKAKAFGEIEDLVAPDALLGSNTSTLPISGLAASVGRPEAFIGLHFFSPVDKMPLLEIIKGRETSEETLHRALDLTRQIKKTPIVVNDSRGFFTSRVIGRFVDEALKMLAEGVPAPSIEQASLQAGYPAPVLQLLDELNLALLRKIRDEGRAAIEAEGGTWVATPDQVAVDRMIDEFDRRGRAAGAGFYEYEEGRRTRLWPGLAAAFPAPEGFQVPDMRELKERMLVAQALEAVRALDEGVIESVADANIGSILGIGYPGWTGGVLQYINGYPGGMEEFVARAQDLAARYGDHFEPPASLVERAAEEKRYGDEPALATA